MTDQYHVVMPSQNGDGGTPTKLELYGDYVVAEDRAADFWPSLVSLGFLTAALRRSARFLCAVAIAGLLVGAGVCVATPDPYQASTTLLLPVAPNQAVGSQAANSEAMTDNEAMAHSRAVAGLVAPELASGQSIDSFLSSYSATSVSDRVLDITVSSSSAASAVLRANAIATAFLQVRANDLLTEQKLTTNSLEQQIGQVKQDISSLNRQISRLSAESPSPTQQSQLGSLRAERSQATTTLTSLDQALVSEQASTQPAVAADAKGAVVLDTAMALPHSSLKHLLLYAFIGLLVALVLAVAVVLGRALASDRLRQRDDVARALGAPVKLSVGRVRLPRRLAGRHGLAAARDPDIRRVAAYLDRAVPRNRGRAAALSVIPVDDPRAATLALVSLALSRAEQGEQVVLADLASGAPAARLLGVDERGVSAVRGYNGRLVIAVPDGDHLLPPAGPFGHARIPHSPFTDTVTAACGGANLLLALVPLDVSLGGDHLATWAADAVAVIAAGRSSWTTISAVGEMIRLSGTRVVSAVLIGADHSDESLGVTYIPDGGGAEGLTPHS